MIFREGDVVGCNDQKYAGVEWRVSAILVRGIVRVEGIDGAYLFLSNELKLLRRPVRAGDVLRSPRWGQFDVTSVDSFEANGSTYGKRDSLPLTAAVCAEWRHADGTPIDPPKRDAAQPIEGWAATEAAIESEHDALKRQLQDVHAAMAAQAELAQANRTRLFGIEAVKPPLIGARVMPPDRVAQLEAAEQRANRLSDECGVLRTENDELLRENARLRRRVEMLERKAKR